VAGASRAYSAGLAVKQACLETPDNALEHVLNIPSIAIAP
jgi:hypothetical protein